MLFVKYNYDNIKELSGSPKKFPENHLGKFCKTHGISLQHISGHLEEINVLLHILDMISFKMCVEAMQM